MDFPGRFMVSRDFLTAPQKIYGLRFAKDFGLYYFRKKDRLLFIQGPCAFTQDHSSEKSVWFGKDKIYGPEKLNIRSWRKYPGLSEK